MIRDDHTSSNKYVQWFNASAYIYLEDSTEDHALVI